MIADKFPHDPEEDIDEAILDMMGVEEPERTRFPRLQLLRETVVRWGYIVTAPSARKNSLFWPTVAVFGSMFAYFVISSASVAYAHHQHSALHSPHPGGTAASVKVWPTESS